MNRKGIRELASKELGLKTSNYSFADTYQTYVDAVNAVGFPFVVKPVMSSSGKGQSIVYHKEEVESAWEYAQSGGRTKDVSEVIVEELIDFDYEITLLTIRHKDGVSFQSLLGTCKNLGTTSRAGSHTRCPNPRLKRHSISLLMSPPLCVGLMAAVFSVWSYSSRVKTSSLMKYLRVHTILG